LLSEPDSCLLLFNSCPCSYWREDVVHDSAAHAGENDDPVEDEEDIVPTKSERACDLVVIGNTKELLGVMAGAGKDHMGKEED
jgi:hypothetical protein